MDYGTGHEACALLFGLSLYKIAETLNPTSPWPKHHFADFFRAYLQITRELQTIYVLEPAGSHGVWGLDDYHALNFWLGAFELEGVEAGLNTKEGRDSEFSRAQFPSCIHDVTVCPPPSKDGSKVTPRTTPFTEKFTFLR